MSVDQLPPLGDTAADRPAPPERALLRARLRAAREAFVAGPSAGEAQAALSSRLVEVLRQLEPRCLGLYWAIRSEFNAVPACAADPQLQALHWALPYTERAQRRMQFRHWDRQRPALRDESGLPAPDGPAAEPDVVLVPCLGYTAQGYRLGYGAGYFDRWMAEHPGVTAVGVAWSCAAMDEADFRPEPHDRPLMLVVTEQGIVGG
jgi:5,10-methenyltetrahydrofolate synthetase